MPPQTLLPPCLDRDLERHTTAALTANLAAARARSTRRAYQQAWRAFQAFAAAHDAVALPAAPLLVGRYLSTLGEACRPSTVQLHAASITAYHRDAGQASPCAHPGVRKVIAGHARRQGVTPRQAQPIDGTAAEAIAAAAARPRAGRGGTETHAQAARRAALDVALVYVTDARAGPDIQVLDIVPPGSYTPITYPAAIVARSGHTGAANEFLAFLLSDEAEEIFHRHGFVTTD